MGTEIRLETDVFNFFLLLSARRTKSARQILAGETHNSSTAAAGLDTQQGGRFWAVSPIIFQSPEDLTALLKDVSGAEVTFEVHMTFWNTRKMSLL